tara:strand:- start:56 stop:649 length:594 start_codon:yes stop_codon:yes gene_type:complete
MSSINFEKIDFLPTYDLYSEFTKMLNDGKINWFKDKWNKDIDDQICLTSTKNDPDNFLLGRASLYYDWDNSKEVDGKLVVEPRKVPLQEEDFTELCSAYKGTLFEEVYNRLTQHFIVGRIRFMNLKPKQCLTWHQDTTYRIHYPMKTQDGCMMIINDEVKHLPKDTWWKTFTTSKHTALNASKEGRLHLVACVLDEK